MTVNLDNLETSIYAQLDLKERSVAWLARKSGIPYSPLHHRLRYRPDAITVDELLAICDALEIGIPSLGSVP